MGKTSLSTKGFQMREMSLNHANLPGEGGVKTEKWHLRSILSSSAHLSALENEQNNTRVAIS